MVTFWVTQKSEEEEFDVLLGQKVESPGQVIGNHHHMYRTCKTKFRGILRKLKLMLEEIIQLNNGQVEKA